MKTSFNTVALPFALALIASAASAQPGTGKEEQARYITACTKEPSCQAALLQIWQTNGKEVAFERYQPPESAVSPMLRGTDLAEKLRLQAAIQRCLPEDRCRSFLAEATAAVRALPADQLPAAPAPRAQPAMPVGGYEAQMKARVAAAMANAGVVSQPQGMASAAPAQDNEAVGVIDFARDPYSNVTIQLAKRTDGNREIQRRSPHGIKRLATVLGHEGKWLIQLENGTELEAADIQLTSRGFLAGTQGTPVSYTESGGVLRLNWPQGFHPAATQRGNVARTGYLLMERDRPQNGGVGKLLNSFKDLGSTLGTNRQEDYRLVDLHSGRSFPININASGKDVMTMSNCQRRNALTNVCRDASSSERLYNSMGKNMGHYAWTINWFKAPGGTYLVALEDGVRNLTVTKLETGEKRIAANRTLGIRDFSVDQTDDGRIRLSAQMAFETKKIEDLETEFASLPPAAPVAAMAQQ